MKNHTMQRPVVPVLSLILAYEWLISFLNKLVTKNYYQNLRDQLSQSISGVQLHFYAGLLKHIGVPHYRLFGSLVLVGEAFVGIMFLILAIYGFRGKLNGTVGKLGALAALIAAFMSLNYAILGGDTLFVDSANAFQEGISIDWLMFLIELTFAFYFYSISTHRRRQTKMEDDEEVA